MENTDLTLLTLGQLLSHKDQNIKRQAMGIFKALPEANEAIGKEYMTDAITRANKLDKKPIKEKACCIPCAYNMPCFCPCHDHE